MDRILVASFTADIEASTATVVATDNGLDSITEINHYFDY
jgi:hypothetical protein